LVVFLVNPIIKFQNKITLDQKKKKKKKHHRSIGAAVSLS